MFKTSLLATSVAFFALTGPALATSAPRTHETVKDTSVMPPDGYAEQWWTHPNGCEYSRAGRPGETVWYLIINTVRPGCPTHIVQRGFSDAY